MKKTNGHLGQKIERKCESKKETPSGYEMTDEYRDAIIADIKSEVVFAFTSKLEYNADTIYLTFNSAGGIGNTVCEKLIGLCNKHRALFFILGTETQGLKVSIYKRLSNAK